VTNRLIDALRAARSADDTISRIQESSLETRIGSLEKLLTKTALGPAELIGAYGSVGHVVARTPGGVSFRSNVFTDKNGDVRLGEAVEVFDVSLPSTDIADEVMETAKAAVDGLLSGDVESITPMVEAIARTMNIKGDLSSKIRLQVNRLAIAGDRPWYAEIAESVVPGEIDVPSIPESGCGPEGFAEVFESIRSLIEDDYDQVVPMVEGADLSGAPLVLAHDVMRDAGRVLSLLGDADITDVEESTSVYEAVRARAGDLVRGLRYLVSSLAEESTDS
jgi:hypothetical protein